MIRPPTFEVGALPEWIAGFGKLPPEEDFFWGRDTTIESHESHLTMRQRQWYLYMRTSSGWHIVGVLKPTRHRRLWTYTLLHLPGQLLLRGNGRALGVNEVLHELDAPAVELTRARLAEASLAAK